MAQTSTMLTPCVSLKLCDEEPFLRKMFVSPHASQSASKFLLACFNPFHWLKLQYNVSGLELFHCLQSVQDFCEIPGLFVSIAYTLLIVWIQ